MKYILHLIIIAILIVTAAGLFMLLTDKDFGLRKDDGELYVERGLVEGDLSDNEGVVGIAGDIRHFASIVKDFLHYSKTGESSYSSGFDAVFGRSESAAGGANDGSTDGSTEGDADSERNPGDGGLAREEVRLIRVVDGDTIIVGRAGDEERIRLIGIDTPESVNPDEGRNNEYGVAASNHTKEILRDVQTLWLEYDAETEDAYGRTLAYVWEDENEDDLSYMVNARILGDGYAVCLVIPPNDRYAESLSGIEESARKNSAGLWKEPGYLALAGE